MSVNNKTSQTQSVFLTLSSSSQLYFMSQAQKANTQTGKRTNGCNDYTNVLEYRKYDTAYPFPSIYIYIYISAIYSDTTLSWSTNNSSSTTVPRFTSSSSNKFYIIDSKKFSTNYYYISKLGKACEKPKNINKKIDNFFFSLSLLNFCFEKGFDNYNNYLKRQNSLFIN